MNMLYPVRSTVLWGGSTWLLLVMATSVWASDPVTSVEPESSPVELSVAPSDHIVYPDDRPQWLSEKPSFGKHDHRIVIVSSPSETAEESLEELGWMERAAVVTYMSRLVDGVENPEFYTFSDEELDRDVVSRRYSGEVIQGDMVKYESAVELRFDESKQGEIKAAWKSIEVGMRLKALGALSFLGLVLLMCSSGLMGIVSRRFPTS